MRTKLARRARGRVSLVAIRAALAAVNAALAAFVADGALTAINLDALGVAGVGAAAAAIDVVKQAAVHWEGLVESMLKQARREDEQLVEQEES